MKVVRAIWRFFNNLRRLFQIIIMLFVIALVMAGLSESSEPMPKKFALVVAPTGLLVDELSGDPFERALGEIQGNGPQETRLANITDSLDAAIKDGRVQAVVLQLDGLAGGGLPKLQAISTRLQALRDSGKTIIAVGDSFSQDQYYLAAHADEIYLNEMGVVLLEGYAYYRTYLKNALEKLKIDLNVFRVGKYKSFVEPFTRDTMSAEDRAASERWVNSLWRIYKRDVGAARGVEPGSIDDYANEFLQQLKLTKGNTAQVALRAGLVDHLGNRDSATDRLIELVGVSASDESTYSAVDFRSYLASVKPPLPLASGKPQIGVVVASGDIVDGEASPGTIGGDSLAAIIDVAANDANVKAVVLRVDSPGGSVFASEVVFDQLVRLKTMGKPLVVSMSSVAASGGYYISMMADEIWASDATITGSIGVGALLPTFQRSLDSLGVNTDGFGTTELSGLFRADRALGDPARKLLQLSVENTYRLFVDKVATAREMSTERADNLAQGRVWIGSDALELGLVDKIGGLDAALNSAANLAGLDEGEYAVRYVEQELDFRERLALDLFARVTQSMRKFGVELSGFYLPALPAQLTGRIDRAVEQLTRLNDPRGFYFHCFCVLP